MAFLCGKASLVKTGEKLAKAVLLPCRSWLCDHCNPNRKKELIAQAHRGKPDTFITLTIKRNQDANPDDAAAKLAWAWRVVRKRAIREAARDQKKNPLPFGATPPQGWGYMPPSGFSPRVRLPEGKLEFLAVLEKHKSGWPHIHILARTEWIDQRWLSAQLLDLIGSPVVWVERIDNQAKVSGYVAKYCGKATHKFGTSKRYWQSRQYQLTRWLPAADADGWSGTWQHFQGGLTAWIQEKRQEAWLAWQASDTLAYALRVSQESKRHRLC